MSEINMTESHMLAGKYLTFNLAEEIYGIETLKVREIISLMEITAVPQTPAYVRGVINLRGKVIPIVDLRSRFGMEDHEYQERTCIIVIEIEEDDPQSQVGVVVDTVMEVLNVQDDDIDTTPAFGVKLATQYISGVAKIKGQVIILLDIERVLEDANFVPVANEAEEEVN